MKLDLQEMHRVFINLFENSVKYRTKERSVIKLILDERGTDLEIRVADDGPGMPEAGPGTYFQQLLQRGCFHEPNRVPAAVWDLQL